MVIFLIILIILSSIIGFIMMGLDKYYAKQNHWRISERTLWVVALIGGAPGSWFGMITFRHKTQHTSFQYGMPILTIIWMVLLLVI
ncbi:DUF1294 domain-containing protein [Alkalibacillus salilacus]|uniref:Uncharacterized membrane protein YsdA (DUF1294 family) n=1 Tax=Alkalibacillus salilacus TaxID=284582 RepID=A0ABT9VGX2_9BACI|nr:DUF1294 domain-containing protein [Alkalibacillus salilacus]MDQ0160214.1 uncharacterized membrane protein YsdA (DUF1294 family) [Alkalibacillus salilacus]